MSHSEIIIALENIIVDKVSTVPSNKNRRNDTSAPMEIAMAAREDGEGASHEGDQRIVVLALQAVCGKGRKGGGKNSWQKGSGKKEAKGQEKGGKGDSRTCIAAWCRKGGIKKLISVDEDDGENAEESTQNEEDLQAWCSLEESENEQWHEVISKQNKRRAKKDNQASLLSMEKSHNSNPKKIVEAKDKWVKVRVTMDSGGAGHVMPETVFSCVKLERKTTPKKFVAANEEQIKDLGEKTIPFKTNEGIQRCITFRSANDAKPLITMQKVVRAGNTVVLA